MNDDSSGHHDLARLTVWFFLTWTISHLLYPAWLLPISPPGRLAIFASLWAVVLTCTYAVRSILIKAPLIKGSGGPALSAESVNPPRSLWLIVALCALLHLRPLAWPLTTRGDEGTLALEGLAVLSAISDHVPTDLLIKAFALVITVALAASLCLSRTTARARFPTVERIMNRSLPLAALCCLSLAVSIFATLQNGRFSPSLVRYPPLYKLLQASSYALFGIQESSARLPQLLFSLGAGIYLYKLVHLYRDARASVLAGAAFLFCPVVFYFGNLAYMESGVLFFCMTSSYHFLKGLKDSSSRDLALSSLFITAGFFYKQPVGVCLIIFALHLLPRRDVPPTLKAFHFRLSAVSIAAFVPWLIIGSRYCWRNYFFTPTNWAQAQFAFKFLSEMPHHVGYVMAAVFALGLPYSLYRRRDALTTFSLLWLCSWYVFYTTDSPRWIGNERFASILYPAFAIISSQIVSDLADHASTRLLGGAVRFIFIAMNILPCTIVPFPPVYAKYATFHDSPERFVPYDQALRFIKQNIPPGKRILCTMGPNPLLFYSRKFGLKTPWDDSPWTEPAAQTPDNLFSYCTANRIDLVLLPGNPVWAEGHLNSDLLLRLSRGQDPRFRVIHRSASGSNTLLLFAVQRPSQP